MQRSGPLRTNRSSGWTLRIRSSSTLPVAVAAMSGGAAAAGAGVLGGGAVLAQNLKEVKGWWDIGSSALSEHVSEPFKNEYAIGRYLTRLSERDVIR